MLGTRTSSPNQRFEIIKLQPAFSHSGISAVVRLQPTFKHGGVAGGVRRAVGKRGRLDEGESIWLTQECVIEEIPKKSN